MTDKKITLNGGVVGGDWFFLIYRENIHGVDNIYNLDHFLTFNSTLYNIYKSTGNQREVSFEEFLDFRFSGYILFKKELYKREDINKWLEFLYTFTSIPYLNKPFPPIEIMKKIKIKK